MSLSDKAKLTKIRKDMFRVQSKITWAGTDAEANIAFKKLMKLREQYRENGGKFKKK